MPLGILTCIVCTQHTGTQAHDHDHDGLYHDHFANNSIASHKKAVPTSNKNPPRTKVRTKEHAVHAEGLDRRLFAPPRAPVASNVGGRVGDPQRASSIITVGRRPLRSLSVQSYSPYNTLGDDHCQGSTRTHALNGSPRLKSQGCCRPVTADPLGRTGRSLSSRGKVKCGINSPESPQLNIIILIKCVNTSKCVSYVSSQSQYGIVLMVAAHHAIWGRSAGAPNKTTLARSVEF
ncbi:hypothetical protein BU24DRAFT_469883 [Aaosphaeria arxii CBS 175.79]|uniref:Uncharacterized protein n=1 Tax=Aaosphaeria arxii CBS 175.79 TaxID=1450172 RepID=A0A6A5Y6E3_9PLEO|nr:uncharacterized protein BU24DRAFT_469883 [Aaosphaeria arxii CBS 175.79]KAF2021132.1 hypothetical protein BU24DRAFT_469883 [Aaosphaeria arxii CBS 175.79]